MNQQGNSSSSRLPTKEPKQVRSLPSRKLRSTRIFISAKCKSKPLPKTNSKTGLRRPNLIQVELDLHCSHLYFFPTASLIMISQQIPTPRLLMEVNYRDPVPKLVSIYETGISKNNTLFEQKPPRSQGKEIVLDQQIGDLKKALISQRDENEELKSLIKELTIKTEKLREVNEALISRIKDVELSYRALRAELEKQNIDEKRKLKVMIYRDIQEYVKASVANFTAALKIEKMTPRLENKVETFLAELMHINSVSVDNFGKKERMQQMNLDNNELAKQINTFVENQAKSQRSNSPMVGFPTRIQYNTVLSKLSHIEAKSMALGQSAYRGSLSKERDDRRHTPSKVGNLRDVYATTPHRRRRIFE